MKRISAYFLISVYFFRALSRTLGSWLKRYPSSSDCAEILRRASECSARGEFEQAHSAASLLRQLSTPLKACALRDSYLNWLEAMLETTCAVSEETAGVRLCSTAVRLSENFFEKGKISARLVTLLERAAGAKNRRLIANALDSLTHFGVAHETRQVANLVFYPDNRVAANALVHQGLKAIDRPLIKRLQRMLSSEKPAWAASALYAVGELAAHYRKLDPIHYRTQSGLLNLTAQAAVLVGHREEMICRQAVIAVLKSRDTAGLAKIGECMAGDPGGLVAQTAAAFEGVRHGSSKREIRRAA